MTQEVPSNVQALLRTQFDEEAAGSQTIGPQDDPVGDDVHWHLADWQAVAVV